MRCSPKPVDFCRLGVKERSACGLGETQGGYDEPDEYCSTALKVVRMAWLRYPCLTRVGLEGTRQIFKESFLWVEAVWSSLALLI